MLYICVCNYIFMEVVSQEGYSEKEFRTQFEVYFKQYFKQLCYYAMSFVKDSDAARDIVHDVFLSVWKHRKEIDFSKPIYPYLLSLTRNGSLNYLTHLKIKFRHEEMQLKEGEKYLFPNDNRYEELIEDILKRIDRLPDRCGEVMRLCFVECKRYKEIAALLGISVSTVKTHVMTGLKILRDEFPPSLLYIFLFRKKVIKSFE